MEYYFTANNYGDRYLQEVNGNSFNKLGAYGFLSEHFDNILLKKEHLYIIVGTDSGQIPLYLLKKGIPTESEYLFIETSELYGKIKKIFPDHPQLHLCQEHDWLQQSEELGLPLYIQSQSAILVRSTGASYSYYKEYPPLFEAVNQHYQSASAGASANSNPFHFYKVGFTNLTENQYNVSVLEDQFKDKTAVLIGAAPSLDQHIEWIQKNQEHLYIFTVSRLAQKLHNLNIIPNFIVTVDPEIGSFYLGKEAFKFEQQSILIHSYHGNPQLVSQWSGEHLFTGFRYPWKTDANDDGSEQTGSTVSNAALDSAITMGFSQILLAGVDFCFDSKGYTHASDTGAAVSQAPMVVADTADKLVTNNIGEIVETTFAFSTAGEEFARTASTHKKAHQTISNLSGSALKMRGVEYIPKEQITLDTSIIASRPEILKSPQQKYLQTCLKELKQTNGQFLQMDKLCQSTIQENKRLFDKDGDKNTKVEGKIIKLEKSIEKKHKALLHLIKRIGQREILKHLHATRKDQELWTHKEVTSSSTSYYKILRETIKLVQISIKDATQRIQSRQQELLAKPKSFSALIEQWEGDKQPRRALFWKQSHPEAYMRLSTEQQEKINEMNKEFIHSFEANLAETIEHNTIGEALSNIINLANNYNKNRLKQLIPKLEEHPDQEAAPYYIVLCEALIAEFDEKDQDAFNTYATLLSHQKQLTEEMTCFILERVSTTSIRLKDYNNAIFALQTLSEAYESDYHTPIYAELLYLTGNTKPAIDVFDKYLEKNTQDIKTIFRLADLQLKEKKYDAAKELYQHILSQDSNYLPAQQRINEIEGSTKTEEPSP
jgi:hypothetical protein